MPAKRNSRPKARQSKGVKPQDPAADNQLGALMGPTEIGQIRRLIRLVQRTGIGELEVSSGSGSVRISAFGASVNRFVPAMMPGAPAEPDAGSPAPAPKETPSAPSTTVAITSPMVGTFYRAPAPDADPYVEVGDRVELGQTVCIVEAMKLMNEIEAEVRGTIVKVLVENAQPVEYGQQLFLVEPT